MENTTHLKIEIDVPCRLSFSERMKAREAAVNAVLAKVESTFEEQRKSIFKQMSEMTMNHFDLKPSEAKLITEYVLNISGAYNHIITKLNLIKEARDKKDV